MVQQHIKHHHHTRPYSWPAIVSGVLIVTTLVLVSVQIFQARRIAGSRPLHIFGKRKLHRVVDYTEYKDFLPELLEHAEPHFVAFTSGVDSEGRPWCPDCAAAMPLIREVVLGAGGSLLEVSAGRREDWANRKHPLRVDTRCPVRYVPTLYYWSEEGCGSSVANPLNSDETEETLRLTVAKFVQETAAGQRYVDRLTREIIQSGGKGCGGC
ncbi:Thioredoxin domain-containing protein 17 [Pleodorina starrii]|uniref:Thioredoxin domain-containing protein 17 n=1 Tax=Pleodorina starrii TaxID=330485 RepID=A0A9W6F612_9CHLO|nr:Thioredoxin domain-containing protein 17 [Pleodorina starrii]GLC57001.1 Thioredoxin domain-containing protein 17 [Pleodorina starrii]GLC64833.1 Thioredoxin domain-containing protein 17 [Pleodorina starrii]